MTGWKFIYPDVNPVEYSVGVRLGISLLSMSILKGCITKEGLSTLGLNCSAKLAVCRRLLVVVVFPKR